MVSRRIEYGSLSFTLPEGYSVLEEASLFAPRNGADQDTGVPGPPVTVTLVGTAAHPDVPDYSESASDMKPGAYPSSITLSIKEQGEPPMAFLHNMEKVMKSHFAGYKIHFIENAWIGEHPAARSQSTLESHFRIFRLNYAWHMKRELATACLTVTASGVKEGWSSLRDFAVSASISA